MPDYQFGDLGYREKEIRSYVEWPAKGEKVTFLEKVATEPLLGEAWTFGTYSPTAASENGGLSRTRQTFTRSGFFRVWTI